MKMIVNYLSNLESYLPEDIKKEVSEELESSIYGQIEDQEQELNRKLNDSEVELLLKNIGHPMRVAAGYLPSQQLVGKELFPAYKKSLKIALTVVLGIVLLLSVPFIFSDKHIIGGTIKIIYQLFNTGLYIFAIVTLVFYSMEYYQVDPDKIYAWSPKQLNSKSSKVKFSRLEAGFEIVMYVLFLAWWNNYVGWPGIVFLDDMVTGAILSQEWQSVSLAINIIVGLSIVIAFYEFAIAGWTKLTLVADIALAVASIAVVYQIAQFDQLITVVNQELVTHEKWSLIANIVDKSIYSILGVIALVSAWDVYSNTRKLMRE